MVEAVEKPPATFTQHPVSEAVNYEHGSLSASWGMHAPLEGSGKF